MLQAITLPLTFTAKFTSLIDNNLIVDQACNLIPLKIPKFFKLKFVSIIFVSEIPDPVIQQEDVLGSCVKDDEAEKTIGMLHLFHSFVLHFIFLMIEVL